MTVKAKRKNVTLVEKEDHKLYNNCNIIVMLLSKSTER